MKPVRPYPGYRGVKLARTTPLLANLQPYNGALNSSWYSNQAANPYLNQLNALASSQALASAGPLAPEMLQEPSRLVSKTLADLVGRLEEVLAEVRARFSKSPVLTSPESGSEGKDA